MRVRFRRSIGPKGPPDAEIPLRFFSILRWISREISPYLPLRCLAARQVGLLVPLLASLLVVVVVVLPLRVGNRFVEPIRLCGFSAIEL